MNLERMPVRLRRRGGSVGPATEAITNAARLPFGAGTRPNPYYQGPESDHFDGRVFFNPDGKPPGSLTDILRWRLGKRPARWPESWPSPFHGSKPEERVDGNRLVITMIGHASLLIQTQGLNILTDPVWSRRVSPLSFAGPRRVNPPGVGLADLPAIDVILVTHNHYDHLDLATLVRLHRNHVPRVVTPLGNDVIIRRRIAEADIIAGDWGDAVPLSERVTAHFVPVHHWSARGLNDRRMALWAGFVIETAGGNILHIGDTGFSDGAIFSRVGALFGPFRAANLPIGAYEPRWFMKHHHVNPGEAVDAMRLAGARMALGHHWGTFQLTEEAIEAPREALLAACAERGLDQETFRPLRPGESVDVPA